MSNARWSHKDYASFLKGFLRDNDLSPELFSILATGDGSVYGVAISDPTIALSVLDHLVDAAEDKRFLSLIETVKRKHAAFGGQSPAKAASVKAESSVQTKPKGRPGRKPKNSEEARRGPIAAAFDAAFKTDKRRGRPPKGCTVTVDGTTASIVAVNGVACEDAPKRRGRPPKNRDAEAQTAKDALSELLGN